MSKAQIIQGIMEKLSKNLRVALPASIISYDFTKQKASVRISLKELYGNDLEAEYPIISNVPVMFLNSGGASLTMPVTPNDSCLLLFMDRDISAWSLGSNEQVPQSKRSHHLNDAIAIIGLNNIVTNSKAENNEDVLLTYSGSNIRLKPDGVIDIHSASEVNIKTNNVIINCQAATINSQENIDITCKGANIKASADLNIECDNANITAAKNIISKSDITNIQANANVNVECQNASIKASSNIATETPNFIQTGAFKVDGNLEITGNSALQGRLTVSKAAQFERNLTCDRNITGNRVKTNSGIDLTNHKHSYIDSIGQPPAPTPKTTGSAQ